MAPIYSTVVRCVRVIGTTAPFEVEFQFVPEPREHPFWSGTFWATYLEYPPFRAGHDYPLFLSPGPVNP